MDPNANAKKARRKAEKVARMRMYRAAVDVARSIERCKVCQGRVKRHRCARCGRDQ